MTSGHDREHTDRAPAVLGVAVLCGVVASACHRPTEPTHDTPEPPPPARAPAFQFEADTPDTVPAGFTEALVGGGGPVRWRIQSVTDAPSGDKVVAQLSDDDTDTRYPHLVRDDISARDVDVTVSFKTISGDVDASAGVVFRYQDRNNFYVVRANALEDNVVAYKTSGGKRSNIGVRGKGDAYGVKARVPHKSWSSLRVIAKGPVFEVFLNGRKLFEAEDTTFAGAGKVGLWTKADAVTQFDDLRVQSLD